MAKPHYRPRLLQSAFVRQALREAAEMFRHPAKVIELIERTAQRGKEGLPMPIRRIWDEALALFRLIHAYYTKEYRDVRPGSIILGIAAVLYFLWPLDIVPDALPLAGWLDDAAVFSLVLNRLRSEIGKFLDWELRQGDCIEATIISPPPRSRKGLRS
jgi:uncharacterized membrane protein YkvA (DUF1232 family)